MERGLGEVPLLVADGCIHGVVDRCVPPELGKGVDVLMRGVLGGFCC